MDPERWRRVESVLRRAQRAPRDAQPELLDELCGTDARLRQEVTSLLEASYEMGAGFLEDLGHLAPEDLTLPDPWIGRRLGPYVVVRELGRGGMSTVYVARRADGQYDHRVAIKILAAGPGVADWTGPSRREAQILANLNHPQMARLLDSGTAHGHPYFVMELVEGRPIHTFCDEQRLSLRDRIELFLRMCDAVQHAHQHLIVHRDLKPGNILVTRNGEPKLLDFGIAKLLGRDGESASPAGGESVPTKTRWLTPAYASPEQLRGQAVDTRTDVYSLGLVLCRLLAGTLPYRLDSSRPADFEKRLAAPWPPPSGLAAQQDPDAAHARRLPTVTALRQALRPDLDSIAGKALRLDPAERYASVAAFAEDLRRHLDGYPVLAAAPSWHYRLRRFVRRERLLTATMALLVVLAVGAVSAALFLARQQQQIVAERDRAESVSRFLVEIFDASNPATSDGPTTARDLLFRAKARFEAELEDQPEVQLRLLTALVDALHRQGLYAEALDVANQARRTALVHLGPDHPSSWMLLAQSGSLYARLGEFQMADRLTRAALLGMESRNVDPIVVADLLVRRAAILTKTGAVEDAESLFEPAVAIYRKNPTADPVAFALSLHELGLLRFQRRDLDAAESLAREAMARWHAALGTDHPDTLAARKQLAYVLLDQGSLEEAEKLTREVLEAELQLYGGPHPALGFTYSRLAKARHLQGDLDGAEAWSRRSLSVRLGLLGEDHPAVAVSRYKLAEFLVEEGNLEEAEVLFQKSLAVLESKMPQALITAHPLSGLGRILLDRGETKTAEPFLLRAAALRAALPAGDPLRTETEAALARCRRARGNAPVPRRLGAEAIQGPESAVTSPAPQ